jgi:hypothetical protein
MIYPRGGLQTNATMISIRNESNLARLNFIMLHLGRRVVLVERYTVVRTHKYATHDINETRPFSNVFNQALAHYEIGILGQVRDKGRRCHSTALHCLS